MSKISLEPYKGVRDFYPQDKRIQNYIFNTWKKVVRSYGYEEYDASVLEPLDLYRAKSSEEIVNEQIYFFKDRGDREVALRPEMTPTLARMIAAKWQELPAPVRWFSIPNLFRYEKPQRGRLREHWQLNCDIFGIAGTAADIEIISIATNILKAFGGGEKDYLVKVNSRKLMNDMYERVGITEEEKLVVSRIIDKKEKITPDAFKQALDEAIGEEKRNKLSYLLDSGETFLDEFSSTASARELKEVIDTLRARGISNIAFSPTVLRGFDYYTDIIFEVFDTNPENPRSLFGGGRYDELVGQFGSEKVAAVGFGVGDVTMQDFLITHNLLLNLAPETKVALCVAPDTDKNEVEGLASQLRASSFNVAVDISDKKLSDQLKAVEKREIPFVIVVGKDELENKKFKLRDMKTREEREGAIEEIIQILNI